MRCKNCGAELTAKNGLYICESCGSTSEISLGYEVSDVYIAYIESDEQGRRTKDSIIGQEIYNKLENAKIKTYFQRISASNISGDEYELSAKVALDSAKIVIILGTIPQHFDRLLEKYKSGFKGKTLLPIYADMNAYDIPNTLNGLQALNYNSVGAVSDLAKNILNLLGRSAELDIVDEAEKIFKKRKKIISLSLIVAFVAILVACLYIVFGTTYVLPSKKYEQAQSFIEKEQYSDAIVLLNKISDYKNSNSLLAEIYGRYVGYYQSDDKVIGLHLSVVDNTKASIEITRKVENLGTVKIIENAEIIDNSISLNFNDSENNQGVAVLTLENEGISLAVNIDDGEKIETFFNINEKSDKPILEEITANTIKKWLEKKTSESELKALGYELAFEHALYKDTGSSQYGIKNTEIKIALYDYDISKSDEFYADENTAVESRLAFGFSAPASLLIPERIGKSKIPYVENDILYVPDGSLGQNYQQLDFNVGFEETSDVITDEMIVSCTSKKLLSAEHWTNLLKEYIYEVRIAKQADKDYGDSVETVFGIRAEGENNTHYLYSVEIRDTSSAALYRINKSTYSIEYITDVYYDESDFKAIWQVYPELTNEFTTDLDLSY